MILCVKICANYFCKELVDGLELSECFVPFGRRMPGKDGWGLFGIYKVGVGIGGSRKAEGHYKESVGVDIFF